MITGISEHVEMWLEDDDCDRTELDFVLEQQDEDYGDELLAQEPLNNVLTLPAEEQPTEKDADAEY